MGTDDVPARRVGRRLTRALVRALVLAAIAGWATGVLQRAQPPLVVVAEACSGSTWVMDVLARLLHIATGKPICHLGKHRRQQWEILAQRSNNLYWIREGLDGPRGMHASLQRYAKYCGQLDAIFLFKAKPAFRALEAAPALKSLGARVAFLHRSNDIDIMVCSVMSCFASTREHAHLIVQERSGTTRRAGTYEVCRVNRYDPFNTQVYANVSVTWALEFLHAAVGKEAPEAMARQMQLLGLGPAPIVPLAYEELYLGTHTPELANVSIAGFRRLLRTLGHDEPLPDHVILREVLGPRTSPGSPSRPKPKPHR